MTSQTLGQAVQQALAKTRHDEELSRFDDNVVSALVQTAALVDPTCGGERVAGLAELLGRALAINDYQVALLRTAACLHDIGKLGIRRAILCKPGPLDPEEEEEMRAHPLIGERLCAPLHFSREIGPIIRHHHERWDGHGYVDGLAGQDIPFLARIVSVVDAYDAMTNARPYRPALQVEEAVRRLEEGAGSQWDPEVTAVFVQMVKRGKVS
jgi:putative two-component system response regulator